MNDNKIVYRLTKDDEALVGSVDELEPYFDKNVKFGVANAYLRNGNYHGYKVERIGVYKKLYSIYNDKCYHVFEGTMEDVCNFLYITPTRVTQVAKNNIRILKQYTIQQQGRKFVRC